MLSYFYLTWGDSRSTYQHMDIGAGINQVLQCQLFIREVGAGVEFAPWPQLFVVAFLGKICSSWQ